MLSNDFEVHSSSTKANSAYEEYTPNKRLVCWAETRKLSVDTAEIIAREDSRKKIRQKLAEGRGRMHTGYESKVSYNSVDTSRDSSAQHYWNRKPMGCFSFLKRFRCK